jgi:hypothetical protein
MTDPKPLITISAGGFQVSDDAPQLPAWLYKSLTQIAQWLEWATNSRNPKHWEGPITKRIKRTGRQW